MNNLSETKINKFKVGDLAVCDFDVEPKSQDPIFNKCYKVEEVKRNLIKIACSAFLWKDEDFRLATPAEVRRYRGFSKELEELINGKK